MSDSLAAVVAHGLLNSLAVVKNGVTTLAEEWDDIDPDQRVYLAEGVLAQAELMADGLDSLPTGPRHRLANHLFVLRGACECLIREGRRLTAPERDDLLAVVDRQAAHAAAILHGVVQSLPDQVLVLLNRLGEDRD